VAPRLRLPLLLALLLCAQGLPAGIASAAASPEGRWLTEKKSGIVEIFRCGAGTETLCGRLAWFRMKADDPNPQALDLNNPDPAKRNQKLCGLVFMTGFKPAGGNEWKEGTVYDPDGGKLYSAMMTLQADGTLRLRGYVLITLIGASEVWSRYTEALPQCPTRG
jgi:uncharacterized protein (DUF2147 family)